MEILNPREEIIIDEWVPEVNTQQEISAHKDFKPKGAMAFFILLIVLCMAVWFSIYYLMLQRN